MNRRIVDAPIETVRRMRLLNKKFDLDDPAQVLERMKALQFEVTVLERVVIDHDLLDEVQVRRAEWIWHLAEMAVDEIDSPSGSGDET